MMYIENPKTKGSGIIAAIPQTGRCPNGCADCFFQSGRSYLEPLDENLPNMPSVEMVLNRVVRVNDGHDSAYLTDEQLFDVMIQTQMRFFNTADPTHLDRIAPNPVVLTVNPGAMTDREFHCIDPIPPNLMFVRVRVNTWNLIDVVIPAVEHYASREVPVVLTFMAYYDQPIPDDHKPRYAFRKRTLNSYWAITTAGWEWIMRHFDHHAVTYAKWIHSCGKIEGEKGDTHCRFCGNCLREYFATMERLRNSEQGAGVR